MFQPTLLPARLGLLTLGLAVLLNGPPRAAASTVIVPDDFSTVQAGIDSGADSILIRAGSYPERVTMMPHVPRVLLADPTAPVRPTLRAVTLSTDRWNDKRMTLIGLHVLGGVNVKPGPYATLKVFEACSFDSGIGHGGGPPDTHDVDSILVRNCSIRGDVLLRVGWFTMESDTIASGGVSLQTVGMTCTIRDCWFLGPGTTSPYFYRAGVSVEEMGPGSVAIVGNVVENCGQGIGLAYVSGSLVEDNVVRNCTNAIRVYSGGGSSALGNDVRQCGSGIDVYGANDGPFRLNGNTMSGIGGTGIAVTTDWEVEVRNNLALRCGGAGIRVKDTGGFARHWVTGNTSALNGGPGYDLVIDRPFYDAWTFDVSNNIGHGNGTTGVRWTGADVPTLACNDWFANTAGATYGVAPGATDLSVDPLFCDISLDDAHLRSDSPLAGGPCGQIGAVGLGCGATPTLVQRFTAGRVSDGVRVVWQVAPGATASEIWVERAEGADGQAWTRPVMERFTDGWSVVELDRSALADHSYLYRLVAMDGGQLLVLDPGILVEGQARLSFALGQVGPSPGAGQLRITFTLAHAAAIRIDVFDLLGRRVSTPAQGMWPAGTQVVGWDGLTHSGISAPAGMYVIHYRYPGGTDKRPVVRMQ